MSKRIALITGATSGIGEGCAKRFADGGYDVIITGRNKEKLDALTTVLEAKRSGRPRPRFRRPRP